MLIFIPALNLKLSVAPSAIIANYLLPPVAVRRLACSNQTLLFSRRAVKCTKKQPSNTRKIPSCQRIWVTVLDFCQIQSGKRSGDGVFFFSSADPGQRRYVCVRGLRASETDPPRQIFNIELTRKSTIAWSPEVQSGIQHSQPVSKIQEESSILLSSFLFLPLVFDAGVDLCRKPWFDSFIELRAITMKAFLSNEHFF